MKRVAVYGLGSIGKLIAKELLRRDYEIVAAIDIDPAKVGRDIGTLLGLEEKLGVKVTDDPEVLKVVKPYVTLHATGSYLDKVFDQLLHVVNSGSHIISTCETLAYPYYRYPDLAKLIDEKSKRRGVVTLGSGVNPGFIFDTLIILLTAVCSEVSKITARRVIDVSKRREPFIKKVGIGLTERDFYEKLKRGVITGHVGYAESAMLVADSLGIKLSRVEERQEPIVSKEPVRAHGLFVDKDRVMGIRGIGIGYVGEREFIRLELLAYVGARDHEEIVIEGEPKMHWVNETGVHGDKATAAIIANLVNSVDKLQPGLRTMRDLVLVSYKA